MRLAAALAWVAAPYLLAQIPAIPPKGAEGPVLVPPPVTAAAPASCQFQTACNAHASGTFVTAPDPACTGQFVLGGHTYTSQIDRYTLQGSAGQGLMVILSTTQLSDALLVLVRASDNSVVKADRRHGVGPATLGLVLPETTTYVLEVAALSTPASMSSYTLDVTCETGGQANLNFQILPSGWSEPVVVSATPGTYQDAVAPAVGDALYVDALQTNRGTAPVTPLYLTAIELDGEILYTLYNDNLLPNWYIYWSDLPIDVAMGPGSHTVTVRLDPNGLVDESNRSDNTYARTFSLTGSRATGCLADAVTLCLDNRRYRVRATWYAADGSSGQAQAVVLTGDTGYFWFFDPTNIEAVVKVLEGCSINGKRWVFASGLTNVHVFVTVTDTVTDATRTYENPLGTAFEPIQDTTAFPCS